METAKLLRYSLVHALGVWAYTALVGRFLYHGQQIFGKVESFWAPAAMLLLLVLSATVTGLLVLGRPAYLYFNGAKAEAIRLLLYTVGWLAVMTAIVFILLAWLS